MKQPFRVYTYNGTTAENTVYVLNKGNYGGKPSLVPFRNSFAVSCEDSTTRDKVFSALVLLQKARIFEYYLHGTAVLTLRIGDLREVLARYRCLFTCETLTKDMDAIHSLIQLIARQEQQLKLCKEMLHAQCNRVARKAL